MDKYQEHFESPIIYCCLPLPLLLFPREKTTVKAAKRCNLVNESEPHTSTSAVTVSSIWKQLNSMRGVAVNMKQKQLTGSIVFLFLYTLLICFAFYLVIGAGRGELEEGQALDQLPRNANIIVEVMQKLRKEDRAKVLDLWSMDQWPGCLDVQFLPIKDVCMFTRWLLFWTWMLKCLQMKRWIATIVMKWVWDYVLSKMWFKEVPCLQAN